MGLPHGWQRVRTWATLPYYPSPETPGSPFPAAKLLYPSDPPGIEDAVQGRGGIWSVHLCVHGTAWRHQVNDEHCTEGKPRAPNLRPNPFLPLPGRGILCSQPCRTRAETIAPLSHLHGLLMNMGQVPT